MNIRFLFVWRFSPLSNGFSFFLLVSLSNSDKPLVSCWITNAPLINSFPLFPIPSLAALLRSFVFKSFSLCVFVRVFCLILYIVCKAPLIWAFIRQCIFSCLLSFFSLLRPFARCIFVDFLCTCRASKVFFFFCCCCSFSSSVWFDWNQLFLQGFSSSRLKKKIKNRLISPLLFSLRIIFGLSAQNRFQYPESNWPVGKESHASTDDSVFTWPMVFPNDLGYQERTRIIKRI